MRLQSIIDGGLVTNHMTIAIGLEFCRTLFRLFAFTALRRTDVFNVGKLPIVWLKVDDSA